MCGFSPFLGIINFFTIFLYYQFSSPCVKSGTYSVCSVSDTECVVGCATLGERTLGRKVGDGVLGSSYPASLDERSLRVAEQEDFHQMRGHGEDHSKWGRGVGVGNTEAHPI